MVVIGVPELFSFSILIFGRTIPLRICANMELCVGQCALEGFIPRRLYRLNHITWLQIFCYKMKGMVFFSS